MRSRQMKVKNKLSLLVAAFVAGLMLFGLVALSTLNSLKVNGPYYQQIILGKDLIADVLPPPAYIIESYLVARQISDVAYRGQLDGANGLVAKSRKLRQEYDTRHEVWVRELPEDTPEDRRLKGIMVEDSYQPAIQALDTIQNSLIPAVRAGNYARARALVLGPLEQSYNEHRKAIDQVVAITTARNARIEAEAAQVIAGRTLALIALCVAIVLLTALGVGHYLNRSISGALQETANALSSTSSQIAATMEEHERTAMHQSAAVHETTATMDELDASFTQTAGMASTAADTARQAVAVAEEGVKTGRQTRDGMVSLKEKVGVIAEQITRLSEQTGQIGAITNLVSDLANQTNMLALNAAVEAARAGEHGKGFSVVASEIRKLADESKKSAERINALVDDIQRATNSTVMATEEGTKTVDAGIRLADDTVEAFQQVTGSSNLASQAAQQTLLSVPQQVTAVKQVLISMESLNTGARETADGIGQTKIGIENLRVTALKLKEMI